MMSVRTAGTSFLLHSHLNPQSSAAAGGGGYQGVEGRLIAFTTPNNYAGRLSQLLRLRGCRPLWCPAIIVDVTPSTTASIRRVLSDATVNPSLEDFSAIAFTSKTGVAAFSQVLHELSAPPLSSTGEIFTISALGNDAKLLDSAFLSNICDNPDRIRVLIPAIATPAGLVESLGTGNGRRVMCPVPKVVGLTEPPVIPNFLNDLSSRGWIPVRVNSYETRWAGSNCAAEVVTAGERLDALVFTSTAEVEGLLKSLNEYGLEWSELRKRCPRLVVAAHGPVTAAGAEKLGVAVDLVNPKFDSFEGVINALQSRWQQQDDNLK